MQSNDKHILITGGAGFIGCHVIKLFVRKYPHYQIYNLDALTYAGNLENLKEVEHAKNYTFLKEDICNAERMLSIFKEHHITDVIHLAAESHVDRSITDPSAFIKTNVLGTTNLLNAARACWKEDSQNRFHHVSTDEVFGSLGKTGKFDEQTAYDPKSPYSASKAASDHIVRAYAHTYGLNAVISNCSNNYGPNQFPEKLIPLVINNIKNNQPLPIYGTGENVRDWLWVEDHAAALDAVFHKGVKGETYCIGGDNEWSNISIVKELIKITDAELGRDAGSSLSLIEFVTDRAGHDFRYAINSSKIQQELSWKPTLTVEEGLLATVKWYLHQTEWLQNVVSGDYQEYYSKQYAQSN